MSSQSDYKNNIYYINEHDDLVLGGFHDNCGQKCVLCTFKSFCWSSVCRSWSLCQFQWTCGVCQTNSEMNTSCKFGSLICFSFSGLVECARKLSLKWTPAASLDPSTWPKDVLDHSKSIHQLLLFSQQEINNFDDTEISAFDYVNDHQYYYCCMLSMSGQQALKLTTYLCQFGNWNLQLALNRDVLMTKQRQNYFHLISNDTLGIFYKHQYAWYATR